jgi:hypothetical protein
VFRAVIGSSELPGSLLSVLSLQQSLLQRAASYKVSWWSLMPITQDMQWNLMLQEILLLQKPPDKSACEKPPCPGARYSKASLFMILNF